MSIVKEAASRPTPTSQSYLRDAASAAAKVLGAGLATAGAVYGIKKLRTARAGSEASFRRMVEFAGDEYKSLSKRDKELVRMYHKAIAQHSPTVASDPMASWHQIRQLILHPGMYGPQTIEQLRSVERMTPPNILK